MNLGDRVKQLLASPKTEWPVIRAEPGGINHVFRNYVVPLAAIPPIAGFIGGSIIGYSMMGSNYRVGVVAESSRVRSATGCRWPRSISWP